MKSTNQPRQFKKLEGYLLIPHELLHVFGYWLVGKPCRYQWGNRYVTPNGSMANWQRLVGILFPCFVFTIAFIVCVFMAGLVYGSALQTGNFLAFAFWLIAMHITGIYIGTTLTDLRQAYLLIFNKVWYNWTPFDIFFWPVVDWANVREKVERGEIPKEKDDVKQS